MWHSDITSCLGISVSKFLQVGLVIIIRSFTAIFCGTHFYSFLVEKLEAKAISQRVPLREYRLA